MLVYADSQSDLSAGELAREFRKRLRQSRAATLADLRILLVMAGQLEQAGLDSEAAWAADAQALTALCAGAFVGASLSKRAGTADRSAIDAAAYRMERAALAAPKRCTIRTPEGFAWYAVYPDAYVEAALAWAKSRNRRIRVLVVGLRSIGTTLAAVVAAALRTSGFDVRAVTVRPIGDPFDRIVALPTFETPDAAIVADEGPGLSGSSMAAASAALERAGLSPHAISFFAAHGNGPGAKASAEVRRRWRSTEVHAAEMADMTLGGEGLREVLGNETQALSSVDVGGGRWIPTAGFTGALPEAIAPRLEMPKLLMRGHTGSTLWKFAGFTLMPSPRNGQMMTSAEALEAKLGALGEAGLTPRPEGHRHGWIATRWIEGRRLASGDASRRILRHVTSYIKRSSNPALPRAVEVAARLRLSEILRRNSECLLEGAERDAAKSVCAILEREPRLGDFPAYGDGHLAPHEWLQDADDRIMKVDAGGHDFDHTAVGPQSVLWDVAGMMVEWRLARSAAAEVLARIGLPAFLETALSCHVAAYSAFRAGVASLCGAEANRDRAVAFYGRRLRQELATLEGAR